MQLPLPSFIANLEALSNWVDSSNGPRPRLFQVGPSQEGGDAVSQSRDGSSCEDLTFSDASLKHAPALDELLHFLVFADPSTALLILRHFDPSFLVVVLDMILFEALAGFQEDFDWILLLLTKASEEGAISLPAFKTGFTHIISQLSIIAEHNPQAPDQVARLLAAAGLSHEDVSSPGGQEDRIEPSSIIEETPPLSIEGDFLSRTGLREKYSVETFEEMTVFFWAWRSSRPGLAYSVVKDIVESAKNASSASTSPSIKDFALACQLLHRFPSVCGPNSDAALYSQGFRLALDFNKNGSPVGLSSTEFKKLLAAARITTTDLDAFRKARRKALKPTPVW